MKYTVKELGNLVNLLLFQIHADLQARPLGEVVASLEKNLCLQRFESIGLYEHWLNTSVLQSLGKLLDPNSSDILSNYRSCLSISLTLAVLAESQNIAATITIGIFRDSSKLHSHAWLTFADGKVVDTGAQSHKYQPICNFRILE